MTDNRRSTRAYQAAVRNLKARGEEQNCWRCGRLLHASRRWPHPDSITLGHLVALEDGGDLLDPQNHAPECITCNMGDGARRTNKKRRGETNTSYRNNDW